MPHTAIRPAVLTLTMLVTLLPSVPRARAQQARAFPASVIYTGTSQGKLFRDTEGNGLWTEVDSGLPALPIGGLAVAPGGTNRVYLGVKGRGMYVTSDGGQHWRQDDGGNAGLAAADIRGVVVDPFDGSYVYALAANGFVYTSSDGGLDWTRHALAAGGTPTSLGISPERPLTLLVGTTNGAQISTDGGYNWQGVRGITTGVRVNGFAFSANDAHVAYAATSDGVYAAFDGGQAWGPVNHAQRGLDVQSIAVDSGDDTNVLAGGAAGTIYNSTDAGVTWQTSDKTQGAAVTALAFDPRDSSTILAGVADGKGIYRTTNGGSAWQADSPSTAQAGTITAFSATTRAGLPSDPVPAPTAQSVTTRYFPQSHHTVRGTFLDVYLHYGGLRLYGLPLTEEFDEDGQRVQYFERVEFIRQSRTLVYLADLGDSVLADRGLPALPAFTSTDSRLYFSTTHHSLSGRFLTFWRAHDGQNAFGDPISEPFYEMNGDGTGRAYLVQYFDAARMEYHPELAGSKFAVTLGLLGQQVLKQRGWL